MKKMIILLSILILVSLIFSGCTDVNVPEITDELSKKSTIVTFIVSPSIIETGSTANLSWVVTGSDTRVNIDNGIGDVNLTGYRIISPTQTTTYKLSAKNSTSIKNATTQITVTINTNEENNNTINPPKFVLMNWSKRESYEGTNLVGYVDVTVKNKGGSGNETIYAKVFLGNNYWIQEQTIQLDSGASTSLSFRFPEIGNFTSKAWNVTISIH